MPSSSGSANRPRATSQSQTAPAADQPPIPISITICGDGGCGKSSITLRLVRSQWTSEYDPTIEDSYSISRRIDGSVYHLALTDTAGQEEYRGMWATSNLGADAFLMVYDITSAESLDALEYFDDLIDMEAETRMDNAQRARREGVMPTDYSGSTGKTVAPVKIVAGNKCDLQESRKVSAATGLDWARKRGCGFMETSARLEVNIEETFALIVRRVTEARRLAEMGITEEEEIVEGKSFDRRGATKPLSPLPGGDGFSEKQRERGPNINNREKVGRGGAFLIRLTSACSLFHPCSLATSGRYVDPYRLPSNWKLIRIPCTPTSQSIKWSASSKSVSSVTAHCRDGSSREVTRWNRLSCSAAMTAYEDSPSARRCASKVPMHPRRLYSPPESLFHVTKRGYSASGSVTGVVVVVVVVVVLVLVEMEVASVSAESEVELELPEGRELSLGLLPTRRRRAGSFLMVAAVVGLSSVLSSSAAASSEAR
ncbi:Ras-like protein 1 [Cytospora mali]|uniref:Ras-like protein 1 n=1 Tax=Cytospora mali TaxID=578113 RepID=A0A194UXR1_CYTMA|nr:Ras-like protein 1 [Valsa mali var. pyri (nom. inval.)]